jgi:hypothetical protein
MKSTSLAKALTLSSLICFALPVACGDDDDNSPSTKPEAGSNAGGQAGAGQVPGDAGAGGGAQLPPGISEMPSTVECSSTCSSAKVGALGQFVYIDPCCAGADKACGLSMEFLKAGGAEFAESCQAKDQPGEPDTACPNSDAVTVPFGGRMVALDPFVGCCRPSGTCGVVVNDITFGNGLAALGQLSLGCVDAAPFFPNKAAVSCTPAGGGAGGAGGMNGMGGASAAGPVGGVGGAGVQ